MGFLRVVRAAALCACVSLMPSVVQAQTTGLFFDSQSGDYIGQGRQLTLTSVDVTFSAEVAGSNLVRLRATTSSVFWFFDFRVFSGGLPVPGGYFSARRASFTSGNGLDVSGDGRGCNELTGRFTIREAVYDGNQVVRFAADFEQHCEDNNAALFGAIRYNSTVSSLVPFDGNYPLVKLSIAPLPSHGRVTGPGLDCGGGALICDVSPPIEPFGLKAIPDPGYAFAGWAQDCFGPPSTTINVNSEKYCAAIFTPLAPSAARTMAVFVGSPGDYVSQGQTHYLSSGNSTWTLTAGFNYSLKITYNGPRDEGYWSLRFAPPSGAAFVPGQQYTIARFNSATEAAFDLTADSRGCNQTFGTLLVREWVLGAGSMPDRFLFDFEYRCDNSPPITGIIEYQSTASLPALRTDRSALAFGITRTNSTTIVGHTPDQVVQLTQLGTGATSWQLKSDQPWLTATPASGTGPGTITIKIKEDGTVPTSSSAVGHIFIIARGAINVPEPVTVTATFFNPASTAAPFGAIDSPLDGAVLRGSVGLTGWALDDVAVSQLRLYRASVPSAGEPSGQLVFVGYPVRVEGARPDVAAAFATTPLNTAAGWGYMLLTNMLPNGGNGSFTFYVYADDVDGHTKLLGTRTIDAANAGSSAPFGAIDTPGQGQVVSGVVNNYGWVLGPGSIRADPPGGGSVGVFIDGVAVGSPSGWTSRADLSALFPVSQYSGIGTALGVFTFDTTALSDGTHTIAWGVTDSTGGTAGVGSRYFTVFNGSAPATSGVASRLTTLSMSVRVAEAAGPTQGRLGFDTTAPYVDFHPGEDGTIVVESQELDRIELRLAARNGRLMTPDGVQPLPMGAAIDREGTFTWQPGVAYVGSYSFLFDTVAGARRVRIILAPQR